MHQDEDAHGQGWVTLGQVAQHFVKEQGLYVYGLDFSPIRGPEGNIEFLIYFGKKDRGGEGISPSYVESLVERAHTL